jgi:undecaprenyl-diphosphatase
MREKRRAAQAYMIGVGLWLTLLVGLSRVYLGYHYPTDVLAGWLAGLIWAVLCAFLTRAVLGAPPASAR